MIVEAEKNDIEQGLGQCVAQMVAARLFNEADGRVGPVHGCVTTGEVWQFLELAASTIRIDERRYYLDDLASIPGAFRAIVTRAGGDRPAGA